MSHFLDRLTYFRRTANPSPTGMARCATKTACGRRDTASAGSTKDRALDPWRELHRLVQLEDLRQERRGDLGDAADRLSAHPARHAQSRAARLLARRLL